MATTDTVTRLGAVLVRFAQEAGLLVRGAAFWTAILLPLAVLALAITDSALLADPGTVLELTALNVACLVAGHGHGSTARHHRD